MIDRYLWVIGGGVLQIPLIKEANALGLKTIVSDLDRDCAALEHADIFAHIDIFNIEEHLNYLKSTELNIVGVLAAGIDVPETMAAMNEFLGLKAISLETALLCKSKDLFRKKMTKLGYPTPVYEIICEDNLDNLDELLQSMPYPMIVKPTNNSASRDMKIFDECSDALKTFVKSNVKKYGIVLLEQMWQGEEQTVECLVDIEGNFHNGFITDRKFIFDNGFPVETGLVHPTQLDSKKQKELFSLAKKVAKDLKIDVGAVKLDTIYTKEGPRIIELTVRHSGGFDCQFLVPRSTGKNILKAAIHTAIGEKFEPKLLEDRVGRFGLTASLWPEPGIITSIEGLDEATKLDGVEEIFLRYDVGDEVKPYIDCASRVIFIIATGRSRDEVANTIEKAKSLIKIHTK